MNEQREDQIRGLKSAAEIIKTSQPTLTYRLVDLGYWFDENIEDELPEYSPAGALLVMNPRIHQTLLDKFSIFIASVHRDDSSDQSSDDALARPSLGVRHKVGGDGVRHNGRGATHPRWVLYFRPIQRPQGTNQRSRLSQYAG